MISGLIFMTWGTLVIEHSWNRVVAFICVLLQLLSLQEPSGWVDLFTPPLFSSDGTKMVLILPHDQGSRNGAFRHVSVVQKGRKVALTSGKFTVTEILSWDWARNLM
jgi:dipeptidyl-peptidase-4